MKILTITWSSELPLLLQGAKEVGLEIEAWSSSQLADPQDLEKCIESQKEAQIIHIVSALPPGGSPRDAYQEYLNEFQGAKVDVINKGVFVYPEA